MATVRVAMARASRSIHLNGARARSVRATAELRSSAWVDETTGRLTLLQFQTDRPEDLGDSIKKARYWVEKNWFVGRIIELRTAFFNFGFKLRAVDTTKAQALKGWLDEDQNLRRLNEYVNESWMELLTTRNVIAIWQPEKSVRPLVFNPEDCEYKDKFAVEVLTIRHQLSDEEINKGPWSAELKAKLKASKKIELRHGEEGLFAFDVLKLQKMGYGLARPDLEPVFQVCAQNESMETSDALLAYIGRNIYEQDKLGAEFKSGTPPALAAKLLWSKQRAEDIERSTKGKVGHVKQVINYDHNKVFVRPDQEGFNGDKYKAVAERLAWWAMPIGQMLIARGVTPFLMELFEGQARWLRERMEGHLNRTINLCFKMPAKVRVQWSNRCFRDLRLATELMKFGLPAGPVSQTSFQEHAGLDPIEERERKAAEAALPKAETTPIYEPNQGQGEKGGRPVGKGDPTT